MFIDFSNPTLIVLNLITCAIWLAAIVDIIRTPKEDWDSGGHKVLAVVLVGGLSAFCFGLYLPVAPAVWFFDWRTKEKWGHHPGRSKDAAVPDEAVSHRQRGSSRSTGTKLRWVGWAIATFLLGLTALSLLALGIAGTVHEGPLYVLFAAGGAGVGYAAWLASRRSAAFND